MLVLRFPIVRGSCVGHHGVYRLVPAFIITVIIISVSVADESMRSSARKANNEQKNMAGERNLSWQRRSVRKKKKEDEQKRTVRRRNWETEEFVVGLSPRPPPRPLVICSFDIIAASYSEAHQRTYPADYLSTDSASLIPLLSSYPVPVSFSAPPEILPLYTSFFVTLATKNAACPIDEPAVHRETCFFESSASVVIDAPQKHSSEKVSGLPWRRAKRELACHRFIETVRL